MSGETNNTTEQYRKRKNRIEAAIRLETPDRVPVTSMVYTFAARFAGITVHDYIFKPLENRRVHKLFNREFQPDMNYMPASDMHPIMVALAQPCPVKLPGRDLPLTESWQSYEKNVMSIDDYEYIDQKGFQRFMMQLLPRIRPEFLHTGAFGRVRNVFTFLGHTLMGVFVSLTSIRDARNGGFPTFIGGGFESPFSMFSLSRSMEDFIYDVFERPETVIRAIDQALPSLIWSAKLMAKMTGAPRVNIGLHREAIYSPKHFEKIALPEIKRIVKSMHREGIVSVLHCDSNWTPHLHYLKELPRASCVIELDSATDIFKAKEVLNNHLCIKGDVPAGLLAHGTRDKVMDYCRRLIDEVGVGGGFILASGCEIPVDAKPENVAAMRESVEKYGWY